LLDAVAAQRVDSAISALPVLEYRTQEISFSTPYFEAGLVLAVPVGSPVQGAADAGGRRIAVEWGSEADVEARALQQRVEGSAELTLKESAGEALAAVAEGQADMAIVDAISLALFRRTGGELVPVEPVLRSHPYVIAVRAQSPELLTAVNQALAALEADGTLAVLREQWLGN
jgi:ABC-type amino acid transport substrate-binding protein